MRDLRPRFATAGANSDCRAVPRYRQVAAAITRFPGAQDVLKFRRAAMV